MLVHLEHVNLGLLKDGHHLFIANDLSFILGVLQVIGLDVFPKLLDDLGARELRSGRGKR